MPASKNKPLDLLMILAWTILTMAFVIIPDLSDTTLRTLLGIPMVLFIPGYMLTAVLFSKKDELEAVDRLALSLGLSIVVVPILGLFLNFSFGISFVPILLTLCFYNFIMVFIAAQRRRKLPENDRFTVPFYRIYEIIDNEFNTPKSTKDRILTGVLIFSIILAAGMIYFVITTPKIGERFTEFYILGNESKADNYPTNLKYNSPVNILVGVVNHEYVTVNYTVQVVLGTDVLTDTSFILDHNGILEKNITFVPQKEGNDMELKFWLFRENNFTAPYRELVLWVNVSPTLNKTNVSLTNISLNKTNISLNKTNVSLNKTDVSPVTSVVIPTGKVISFKLDSRRGFIPFDQPPNSGNAIEIQAGDKIVWFNDGKEPVTLISDIPEFGTRLIDFDKREEYIFLRQGTYNFYFENNKNFNSSVIVTLKGHTNE